MHSQAELLIQIFDKAVNEMDGSLIGELNQRILAFHHSHLRIVQVERGQVRIVLPQLWTVRADIRDKLIRVTTMQIAHRRGEHDHVPRRLIVGQNQFLHRLIGSKCSATIRD